MGIVISIALTIVAVLVAIPVTVFCVEIIAAVGIPLRSSAAHPTIGRRGRVAVLVPAHNESSMLLPTLSDIRSQLSPGDRLLVIADNCSDDTAAIAVAAGAEVIERRDLVKRGKGYALDFGLRHLVTDQPDIVLVVDADCRLMEGAVDALTFDCSNRCRPAQALYLMTAPAGSRINGQVAEFAWRVKNWLRPTGLGALRLPCHLAGTGMAFPWNVIRTFDLANGCLTEDLKLGLDLASAGHPPVFCPSARVTSQFASSDEGTRTQRKRWEQGHISMILTVAPGLVCKAIARRNWPLLALTLDLVVPPLSLLSLLVGTVFVSSVLAAYFGLGSTALIVSAAAGLVFLVAAFLAWIKCGRDIMPPKAILSIVPYVFRKLGLYGRILSGRLDMTWIRTDREKNR